MFRNAQCEGPAGQGTGLYGKEEGNLVERADLLSRPLRTRMVGGVGAGREVEAPGCPIRLHLPAQPGERSQRSIPLRRPLQQEELQGPSTYVSSNAVQATARLPIAHR